MIVIVLVLAACANPQDRSWPLPLPTPIDQDIVKPGDSYNQLLSRAGSPVHCYDTFVDPALQSCHIDGHTTSVWLYRDQAFQYEWHGERTESWKADAIAVWGAPQMEFPGYAADDWSWRRLLRDNLGERWFFGRPMKDKQAECLAWETPAQSIAMCAYRACTQMVLQTCTDDRLLPMMRYAVRFHEHGPTTWPERPPSPKMEWDPRAIPVQVSISTDDFGESMAAARDLLVVSSDDDVHNDNGSKIRQAGVVHVFRFEDEDYALVGQLRSPKPQQNGMFGAELVMDDQVIAVLELPKRGPHNIHLFDASSLEFQQTLASPPPLTELLLADNRLFVLWKHGIEIYARSAGARWKAVDRIEVDGGLTLRGDMALGGDRLFVGAEQKTGSGSTKVVAVFGRETGWPLQARLEPPASGARGSFGTAIELSGAEVFVADPGSRDATWKSAVHGYQPVGNGEWSLVSSLLLPAERECELLGGSIVVQGDLLLASTRTRWNTPEGCPEKDKSHIPTIQVFEREDGQWVWRRALGADLGQSPADLGEELIIHGGRILASAPSASAPDAQGVKLLRVGAVFVLEELF